MKHNRKRIIASTLVLALLVSVFARWVYWKNGKVLVESVAPSGHHFVRVRSVPSQSNLLWMFVSIHTRIYRGEYYTGRSQSHLSSQSFSSDSYIAEKIEVVWDTNGVAEVYFDGILTLICAGGHWDVTTQ